MTTTAMTVTTLYRDAQQGLARFNKYIGRIKKFTGLLDVTNLKCYDVAYQLEEGQEDVFNHFCECELANLDEYLGGDFIDIAIPIGRTSSFRWVDEDLDSFIEYLNEYHLLNPYLSGVDHNLELYDSLEDYIGYIEDQDDDLKAGALEEVRAILIELTFDSLMRHFKEFYAYGIKGYRYVRDFKVNQVAIFKEYLEG